MLRACLDCRHLSGITSAGGLCTIECARHPVQRVTDAETHLRTYVCESFEPKRPSAGVCETLHRVQSASLGSLSAALERWFAGPPNDVTIDARGAARLSVADGDLKPFESDDALKSYKDPNNVFGDVLGRVQPRSPFVVYLSRSNAAGADVTLVQGSDISIVSLGRPYSLAEITAALSFVLGKQEISVVSPWFLQRLRERGIDPSDPSFSSFVSLPVDFDKWLAKKKSQLLGARTIGFEDERQIDLEAVAELLFSDAKKSAVIRCDGTRKLHWIHEGKFERDVAEPSEINAFLKSEGIESVILELSAGWEREWRRLPTDSFEGIKTVFVLGDPKAMSWATDLPAFHNFKCMQVSGQ